jgi:probable phosphoglycerate mutase
VRHGQQGDNGLADPMRRYGGDAALSDLGMQQAVTTARALATERFDAIYTSPLLRASGTAAAIATHQGLEPVVMDALIEIQGWRDLPKGTSIIEAIGEDGLAEFRRRLTAERRWEVLPFSEPAAEFRARVHGALDEIRHRHPEDAKIAVVCHAGVINTLIAKMLGMTTDLISFLAHASISRVAAGDGRLAVRSIGDEQHLRSAGLLTY